MDNIPDKLREKVFEKMFAAAEVAKLNPTEYNAYVRSLNSYRDLQNSIDTAKAEGRAEGRAEGEAKGIAKGRAEGKAEGRAEGEQERLRLLQEIEDLKKQLGK